MGRNWTNREKKKKAEKDRMPKHGRSILSVLEVIIKDKAEKAKAKIKRKKKKNGRA